MHTFRFIVFLVSAVALPCAAVALLKADMKVLGKMIIFAVLAVASRYLLGAVWTPEETWQLVVKFLVSTFAFVMLFMVVRRMIAMTKFGRILMAVGFVALLVFCLSPGARAKARSYTGSLNDCIRVNVVERWDPIKRSTEKIVAAWDVIVDKDRRIMAKGKVGNGKLVASSRIRKEVARLRDDLLTVDSKAVLASVRKYDAKIAAEKKILSVLREKRDFNPNLAAKLDPMISRNEANVAELEKSRAEAIEKARSDLKGIGLDLPENSPFMTVDLGDIIDNAIVAKNIGFVVENLKALVDADKGNANAAKRYYGAYIVMLDVQAECFRQYLAKAATGIWRDGIVDVAKNAEAAMNISRAKADAAHSEADRTGFLHAVGTNEKTLKAAKAYLAILARHEEIMREKLAVAEKRHEIALSFWESVDIASALGERALADMADFDSLLELKLPEIAFFDDEAMQAEFDAITRKLDMK